MNLVIVESPTKAKTISRFLGKDYKIESSNGHIRDLPKGEFGIDVEKDFEAKYVTPRRSLKNSNKLNKLALTADKIILATDEDREGEAIAWHLEQNFIKAKSKAKMERISFHEITKEAIKEALTKPRSIDKNLVEAQQARRILDRLVGYKLSPFLWKKLMRGLSAGRVQSVALRIIMDREKEIRAFKSDKYWSIHALFNAVKKPEKEWEGELRKINDKSISKPGIMDAGDVKKTLEELKTCSWSIDKIEKKARETRPSPPFTTSTLQQSAWQKLRFSAKKTMVIAQQLYEGLNVKKEGGAVGLITYMRTDSLNVSENALEQASDYIKKNMGEKYALPSPKRFKTKSKTAQEAHEAIRPANPNIAPESIKSELDSNQYKLYELIWSRFIATQMVNAIFENTTIDTKAICEKTEYIFRTKGNVLKFDGFLKVYNMSIEEKTLPEILKDEGVSAQKINSEEHETQPPARYGDASLVKILEKHNIGRPSTYSQIISTIEARNYVIKNESKKFEPTEIGEKVNNIMVEHFPQIVDIDFTAEMEETLDKIAVGKSSKIPVLRSFYEPFEKNLEEKYLSVEKEDLTEETDEKCEKCGKNMLIKYGRFGKFMACSGFPECKTTKNLPGKDLNIKCPICKDGDVVEKRTKRKRIFFGCSVWPKCEFATWYKPTGTLCEKCNSPLIETKKGIKCSNKECDNV